MPERQIQTSQSLQQWKGVNQRDQVTLVHDGFANFSEGLYYGLGDNAERIAGKVLKMKLTEPVLEIVQMGQIAIVQTLNTVRICPITELTS